MTDNGTIALGISAVLFALAIFDRVWGSGNRSATFATKTDLAELRKDVFLKHDTSEGNVGQAIQGLKDASHRMELEAMQFRAVSAETYMRRDSYYKAMGELKTDVKDAFEKIDKRLERMEDTMESNRKSDKGV